MVIEDTILIELVHYLKETFEISGIYLFGSALNGNFTDESDIDIALFIKDYEKYSMKDFAKAFFYVQNNIGSRFELHFFSDNIIPLTFPDYVRNSGKKVA